MCECEQFYQADFVNYVCLRLGFLNTIPIHGLVCLNCGFVATHLDQEGLEVIRKRAWNEGLMTDGNPRKAELPEL